ncbi:hypothetical protein ACFWTE_11580 [Nocardiopsis sp. NPDC058631]|uniref:hypothetical protein n=1 Tax=Nocardiopsis sp. NPDC058631 TaxID=3346566 RepID=UPI003669E4B9
MPHTIEQTEARTRGNIALLVVTLFGLVLLIQMIAVIIGAFTGVPIDELTGFFQTVTDGTLLLVTLALGYYFGARSSRVQAEK